MSIPRTSLRTFLVNAKSALHLANQGSKRVTIVVGNESADLDSLASSILFAYIRTFAPPAQSQSQVFSDIYIPLINIPSADIRLRPEFLALLPNADLEPGHLITLDDLPGEDGRGEQLRPQNTEWILVDHNVLTGALGDLYRDRVRGVIDHHEDEGVIPTDPTVEPRIVENAGSCASLVTNYLKDSWDQLSSSTTSPKIEDASIRAALGADTFNGIWDTQLAQLAWAAILVDTSKLTSQHKTTDHDRKAVEYLESKIAGGAEHARDMFYWVINKAKKNIGHLSTADILRRDYKEWVGTDGRKLGISSVPRTLSWQVEHAGEANEATAFIGALQRHAIERRLSVYAIMSASKSAQGNLQRELLVWAPDLGSEPGVRKFAEVGKEELGLVEWGEKDLAIPDGKGYFRVWWQRDVSKSRKQVAPLLRRCLNEGG
ncbi:MAG: Exopolyphosphatase [Watsoniomyces obsoletus]|nr:MAG: Exopolyphosphatase [Watsoniomyces obsoletus]